MTFVNPKRNFSKVSKEFSVARTVDTDHKEKIVKLMEGLNNLAWNTALRLLPDRRLSDCLYSKKVVIPTKALETLLFRPVHKNDAIPMLVDACGKNMLSLKTFYFLITSNYALRLHLLIRRTQIDNMFFHEVMGWHIFGPELWNSAHPTAGGYTHCAGTQKLVKIYTLQQIK